MPSPKRKKRKKTETVSLEKVTIKVKKPSAAVDPVLVSFPGGVPSNPPEFEWRKLHPKSLEGRVVEGSDSAGTCFYKATSQGMGFDDRRTKVCVGIYDKEKGVVTLHQVASKGTVYALQQHLKTYEETIEKEVATNSMELFADFGSAKKRKVLKSQQANRVNVDTVLGSGKAMIDSMMDNEDDKDAKMSESNRKAIAQAMQQQAEDGAPLGAMAPALSAVEAAHEQARRSFLPPYNAQAESVSNVYDFKRILGYEGWQSICKVVDVCLFKEDFVEAITRGRPDKEGNVPPPEKRDWANCVLECLRYVNNKGVVEIAQQESAEDSKLRVSAKYQLRCIILLHFLVRFYKKFLGGHPRGRIVAGLADDQPRWFGIPRACAAPLLQSFAMQHDVRKSVLPPDDKDKDKKRRFDTNPDAPRYMMSAANKDRCLVHILLVYLMARGGPKSMQVDDMTKVLEDVDLEAKPAGALLRMAGCTVVINSTTKRTKASLTVPLTFPKPKRRGGKSGR